ncbi:MAG TPA: hypothetical protein DEV81_08880, partial [Cyanobacteria bacterium UBA11049]|nr:hypothetical protein [Cyanobacteria bacterium UBA11049]
KNLLFLGALTLFYPNPLLATEPPNAVGLEIEKPQIIEQQQQEYRQHNNQRMRKFNFSPQESLKQTYRNKVQWQSILNEIQERQRLIKQDRFDRVLRLPIR